MKCPKCKHQWQFSGPKPIISNQQFMVAYNKAGGVIAEVARALGIKGSTAAAHAYRLGLKGKGHAGQKRYPEVSESKVLKAWIDGRGASRGAVLLGMPLSVFYDRLRNIKEYQKNTQRFVGQTQRKRMVTEIIRAVAKANGNYSEAALTLGISRERMRQLVERDVVGDIAGPK